MKGRAVLAPLAGISNRPFRVLAIRSGAALTYTEMVSSEGIIRNQRKTLAMMEFRPDEQPIGIQLFGAKPEVMGQAAGVVAEQYHPDLIDINFGCPVKKVVRKNGGAAVLKDLELTEDIIRAVVEAAGRTPVTIKMRTGWDDKSPVYLEVGRMAQRAGVSGICLHARSRADAYSGQADWSAIRLLKQAISIPVIGNGDIFTAQDARRMIDETACDAVMVGRAAMLNPLVFRQINEYLETGRPPDDTLLSERVELACLHTRLMAETYGEERGIRMMRRSLVRYLKGFERAAELRRDVTLVNTVADVERILHTLLAAMPDA